MGADSGVKADRNLYGVDRGLGKIRVMGPDTGEDRGILVPLREGREVQEGLGRFQDVDLRVTVGVNQAFFDPWAQGKREGPMSIDVVGPRLGIVFRQKHHHMPPLGRSREVMNELRGGQIVVGDVSVSAKSAAKTTGPAGRSTARI